MQRGIRKSAGATRRREGKAGNETQRETGKSKGKKGKIRYRGKQRNKHERRGVAVD